MKRKEIINEIINIAGDEFETISDVLELAYKSKKELQRTLTHVKNYNYINSQIKYHEIQSN
tara:strand:- start:3546 stop:3728 length:183 start_codon:yes stop_codon:yes gene_type:complete